MVYVVFLVKEKKNAMSASEEQANAVSSQTYQSNELN
jgi:hypothetical protein